MSIHPLIEQLRIDHENSRCLLALLERELDKIRREAPADFDLMGDVMHYMTHYPELVHHRVEEGLVERLCDAPPEGTALTRRRLRQRLGGEHRTLAERGREFHEAIGRVVDGGLTLRTDLVDAGAAYVEGQREHMEWEEEDLFLPALELGADTLDGVHEQVRDETDPLFGPIRESEYAALWKYIQDQKT